MQNTIGTEKKDIYQQVTKEIIKDLENGHIPWESPWDGGLQFPQNAHTKAPYSGINVLILWMKQHKNKYASAQWATFKQLQEIGGRVRKGEKGTAVIFYKKLEIESKTENGETEVKKIPILRTHVVFNLSQCEGVEELLEEENGIQTEEARFELSAKAEKMIESSGAQIFFDSPGMAFYSPTEDTIHLPARSQFKNQLSYYATVLHELTHWTGHQSRLARELPRGADKRVRAQEELIAEIGAGFLCAHTGLTYTSQHAAYIETWIQVLKEDKNAIFKAAARAREAVELLMRLSNF